MRTLLILVTIVAIVFGTWINRSRRQQSTVELVRTLGGEVHYSYEMEEDSEGLPAATSKAAPPGPSWVRAQMGIDSLDYPAGIRLHWDKPYPPDRFWHSNCTDLVSSIFEFTELQSLGLCSVVVRDEDWPAIEKLTTLEALSLKMVRVSSDRFEHVSKLAQLKYLMLNGTGIDARGFSHLKALTNLTHLRIYDERHAGEGLEYLETMQSLRTLDLRFSSVSDADLEALSELKNLENLYLSNTSITGIGLKFLSDLPKLRILDISDCNIITEQWIEILQENKPKLLVSR